MSSFAYYVISGHAILGRSKSAVILTQCIISKTFPHNYTNKLTLLSGLGNFAISLDALTDGLTNGNIEKLKNYTLTESALTIVLAGDV